MSVLAAFAYFGAMVAFVTIFVTESHKSTTETLIMTTDNTGQDGYTCTMISKVTASYEIVSEGMYGIASQAFQLINVIESKAQYQADYAIADPCSQPLEFFPGNRNTLYSSFDVTYGAAALYMEDTAYIALDIVGPTILRMNYTNGEFETYAINTGMSINSIAVDADMHPIFIATELSGAYGVYRLKVAPSGYTAEVLLYNVTTRSAPIVLNDNLYNIYLAENTTFTALDVYSDDSSASNTTLFTTRDGEYITYAAVYNSGSSVKVYYINNKEYATVWEDGVFTDLGRHTECVGITVDGADNYYFLYFDGGKLSCVSAAALSMQQGLSCSLKVDWPASHRKSSPAVHCAFLYMCLADFLEVTNAADDIVTLVSTISPATGFVVTRNSARAIIVEAKRGPDFVYNPLDMEGEQFAERVYVQQGFSVGYFTCGNRVLNDTQFKTYDDTAYTTVCKENGVIGQVVFENSFLFTTTDVETYAYLHGPSHCAALTDPITETIADLPPYSCSRTIHPSFLACFATAAANTQLLFQVLVFVSALALSKLAARYPPKTPLRVTTPITPCAVEMTEKISRQEEKVSNPLSAE
jgi:hypothetical protein